MKYEKVSLKNIYMKAAYNEAKKLYLYKQWNLKTTPVAAIVKNEKIISIGACANGAHAITGFCERLNKPGSSYDECENCKNDQHAEIIALKKISENFNLFKAKVFLYGHYKCCDGCIKNLNNKGINECYLLNNSEILFDRHNSKTVLGTDKQFII